MLKENFLRGYIIWDPDPAIVSFDFLTVRWYSFFFALAFIASYLILEREFRFEKASKRLLDQLAVYVGLATIAGARIGHCLFYDFAYYSKHPLEIVLPVVFSPHFSFVGYQGLASHGGAIGILIAVLIFVRVHRVPLLWVLDKLSLVVPLAGFFIRLGNFMNSEIIGKPTDAPWGVIFSQVDNVARHPAQLYEALLYVLIFFLLNILHRRFAERPGKIFGIFLILLFTVRFGIEFLKENQSDFESGMILNMGQILSIPFILLGMVLVLRKAKHTGNETN